MIGAIRNEHRLEDVAAPIVTDFDSFRESIRALGEKERQQYQDDATKDPAAALLSPDRPAEQATSVDHHAETEQ